MIFKPLLFSSIGGLLGTTRERGIFPPGRPDLVGQLTLRFDTVPMINSPFCCLIRVVPCQVAGVTLCPMCSVIGSVLYTHALTTPILVTPTANPGCIPLETNLGESPVALRT